MSIIAAANAPASYIQRSMWAAQQRYRSTPLNVMILPWRIQGALHIPTLEAALGNLIARHSTLRTRLSFSGGQLLQVIEPAEPVMLTPLAVEGASPDARLLVAKEILREEGHQPLDLVANPPVRLRLLRLDEVDHVLCFFVHHAMCDGWSSQVMARELAAFYIAGTEDRESNLTKLPWQYADFADWQIRTYESGGFANEIIYWRTELANSPPPLELPTITIRKGNRDWRAASPASIESPETLAGLKDFARHRRVSLFSVLLAGVAVLLHQRTGVDDLVIGVSTVNRWSKEAMALVGCVSNLLPARIRLSRAVSFGELVTQVHATIRRLLAFGRIPLELILREIQVPVAAGPVFPVWCQFREPSSAIMLDPEGLRLTPFLVDRAAVLCDLEADLIESDRSLECVFAHRTTLFQAPVAAAMLADYSAILRSILTEPNLRVGDLCAYAGTAS